MPANSEVKVKGLLAWLWKWIPYLGGAEFFPIREVFRPNHIAAQLRCTMDHHCIPK